MFDIQINYRINIMKRFFLNSALVLLAIIAVPLKSTATVSIVIEAGILYNSNGTTPMPDGGLLQLVADTGNDGFTAPTTTSFIGNSLNDVVLSSWAMDSTTAGVSGADIKTISFSISAPLATGQQLMLRWFPSLTISSSTPGLTSYGQFTTTSGSLLDGSTMTWYVPANGGTYGLNFLTGNAGGSQLESAGTAAFATVPEPTSFALLGAGMVMMVTGRRRRK